MIRRILCSNRPVILVHDQRYVRSQSHGVGKLARPTLGLPLVKAKNALGRNPLLGEQGIEEIVVPSRRAPRPRPFKAGAHGVLPQSSFWARAAGAICRATKASRRGLEVRADFVVRILGPFAAAQIAIAMSAAQGMATSDQGHRLTVRPAHAVSESVPDLEGGEPGRSIVHPVRIVVLCARLQLGAFRIHVDQANGMARLEPLIRLLQLASDVVCVILLRPSEGVRALEV
mmetsp:Transcript_60071/g.112207  ORF Transcript_60071/g.112207 Transcript_60071/m.112207 type:complete len:230 (+) Transcript_60071:420-1109(+)